MPSNLEFCVWTGPKESESKDANESKRECSRHDSADPVEEEGNRDGSKDRIPEEKRIKKFVVPEKGLKGIAFGVHENNQGKKDGILERRN